MQTNEWDLPDPPGVEPVVSPSLWRWIVAGVLVVGLILAGLLVPIPAFYRFLPGPTSDTETLVEVEGASTYSSEGELLLTTVRVDTEVTFFEYVVTLFDSDKDIVQKEDITGGGSLKDLQRQSRLDMLESKRNAEEVALAALGLGKIDGEGARVVDTLPDTPAAGSLQPGDLIIAIDDRPVETTCNVHDLVASHAIGDAVDLTVRRNGHRETIDLQTAPNPTDPTSSFLGIRMRDVNYAFHTSVEVKIQTGDIGGPSAGIMLALAVYDQLTPDDLTEGQTIAGTGEIGRCGDIAPIGGIVQKIAAAKREGATVFLSPVGNFEDAEAAAGDDLEVVSIATFDDALEYLEGID